MVVDDRIVGEIEDVFLMGSWDKALKKSSEILIERQVSCMCRCNYALCFINDTVS
jgi:hypothetical protein